MAMLVVGGRVDLVSILDSIDLQNEVAASIEEKEVDEVSI